MSEEKISIVLHTDDDIENFKELKEKCRLSKNIDVFRKLVSFYKTNSPLYRITGGED